MDRSEQLELARIIELLQLSDFARRKLRMESALASKGISPSMIVTKARAKAGVTEAGLESARPEMAQAPVPQAEAKSAASEPRQHVRMVQEHPPIKTLDDLPEYSREALIEPALLREWRDGRIKVKGERRPQMTRAQAEAADAAAESSRARRGTTWMS